ncbi:MAG TPA: hypothetical protein VEC06_15650 [Paucimonas sp.]|nr:hypothetical protein [Paucimonas sp.]
MCFQTALAADKASQLPLLVIGASYSEGKTPFNNGVAPLGGIAVGFGRYLSLGEALARNDELPGFVINEGQAGAGTFARPYCAPGAASCGPAAWDSYQTQFQKALSRVALPPSFAQYNAKYVVVTIANDCLHADAFGIPQSQSQPCTYAQMNATVDRLVALGNSALAKGITPIFDVYPRYESLDLPLFRSLFGLQWVIGAQDYNTLRNLAQSRLKSELPGALVLDIWKDFTHIGDGIHPDYNTARNAARIIARKLKELDSGTR